MINWRQLYNESQAIQPEDTNVSTERICRLVNIYKNDMIEQDLHRYAQRLSRFFRCCQICTSNSYTIYKWLDTYISGDKNLFDFRLSGRSVSALVYYWNKTLLKQDDKRGQLSDFKQNNDEEFSISVLSNIDENILIKKHFWTSNFISQWITRFQMYYTNRKAQHLSSSIQVHIQPMKTLRYLFQTNISSIFICFLNEDTNLRQLFWTFRHLITIFNWPLTTKIFSNRSCQTNSIFERMMMNSLGFIDLSSLNTNHFCYLYRCLKTCQTNGPMIFLFDYSTIFKPKSADYALMSFLCDLIRFDLSIPDLIIIPTCLYKSYLSFSQPFLFQELVEFFIKKFQLQGQLRELIKTEKQKIVYNLIDCLFLHLGYDINQLISTRIEFSHIIAAIELCQINPPSTVELIFNTLQSILTTCPFINTDNHQWNKIITKDIEEYYLKFEKINSKLKLISVVRKEYFLDILSALTILSKIEDHENISRIFEFEIFNQIRFFLFIFDNQQYLTIRPCQKLQQIIQHCQLRNYISTDYIPQKSMAFRDTILSDHEWSDEDEDGIDNAFVDHDDNDDEIMLNDPSNKNLEPIKPFYRINSRENFSQLKFFARLFGPLIEAIVYILQYHIDKPLKFFTLEEFNSHQSFYFSETSYFISKEMLSVVRRAYAYRLFEHLNVFDEIPMFFEVIDEKIYPLIMEKLVSLHDEFVKLLNCLI